MHEIKPIENYAHTLWTKGKCHFILEKYQSNKVATLFISHQILSQNILLKSKIQNDPVKCIMK